MQPLELTDQDVARLVRRVMRQQNPKLLLDAIRVLVNNRVSITRELRHTEAILEKYRQALAEYQKQSRERGSLRRTLSRILFGDETDSDPASAALRAEHARVARENRLLRQQLEQVSKAGGRQKQLEARLRATAGTLRAYEKQISEMAEALKGTISADEFTARVRQETSRIRKLLSEARQNAHNAEQIAEALRVELHTTRKQLDDAQHRITDLEAEREALIRRADELESRLTDTRAQLEQAQEERDQNALAREQALSELDRVRYENEAQGMRLRELEGELAVLRQHRQELIRSIEENVKEKRRIRGHLREALEELHELRKAKPKAPVVVIDHGQRHPAGEKPETAGPPAETAAETALALPSALSEGEGYMANW